MQEHAQKEKCHCRHCEADRDEVWLRGPLHPKTLMAPLQKDSSPGAPIAGEGRRTLRIHLAVTALTS